VISSLQQPNLSVVFLSEKKTLETKVFLDSVLATGTLGTVVTLETEVVEEAVEVVDVSTVVAEGVETA
jgi:hypothetical protein